MVALTPPSSSATTPAKPATPEPKMDVDSPAVPLSPSAEVSAPVSDEEARGVDVAEAEGEGEANAEAETSATPNTAPVTPTEGAQPFSEDHAGQEPGRRNDLLDAEIVDRWNKDFGDVFSSSYRARR